MEDKLKKKKKTSSYRVKSIETKWQRISTYKKMVMEKPYFPHHSRIKVEKVGLFLLASLERDSLCLMGLSTLKQGQEKTREKQRKRITRFFKRYKLILEGKKNKGRLRIKKKEERNPK